MLGLYGGRESYAFACFTCGFLDLLIVLKLGVTFAELYVILLVFS